MKFFGFLNYSSSLLRQSAHGWRLTYFDSTGDPVASFWSTTKADLHKQAAAVPLRPVA